MKVLLIEDDQRMVKDIKSILESQAIHCEAITSGEDGLEFGKLYDYDAIILDIGLPDINGVDILKRLRLAQIKTPVIIVSGLSEIDHKLRSFYSGADDYLTKPFNKEELLARIQAIIRRSRGFSQSIITTGRLSINLSTKTVQVDNTPIKLTSKEYAILELLLLRKNVPLSKEMFLNHLYNGLDEPDLKIIDVFICKLRKKLANAMPDEPHAQDYIETVWGRGYTMRDIPTKDSRDDLDEVVNS